MDFISVWVRGRQRFLHSWAPHYAQQCNVNLTMQCSGFIGEADLSGSNPRKKTLSSHPSSSPVPINSAQPSSPATDSRHHLITLRDQLHSVLRSNPSRENGVFGGKRRLCMLTDCLVCIM
jgi:hypothetical protein